MRLRSGEKVVAPPDGWFKPGTAVTFEEDYDACGGLFRGIRVCQNPASEGQHRRIGEEYEDGEVCPWAEFTERWIEKE